VKTPGHAVTSPGRRGLQLCPREAASHAVEESGTSMTKVAEAFTCLIHLADNRQTSRRYLLTMAHEQTSDAAS
jgi:hypothetical protein